MTKLKYGLLLLAFWATAHTASAQAALRDSDLQVLPGSPLEKQYDEMLQNSLLERATQISADAHERLNALKSESDFLAWQQETRHKFLDLIGGLPSEKTPLNPRVSGELQRNGYTIRRIVYESRPELYVTANLYLPAGGVPPYPAVLAPCGHYLAGKADDTYQRLFIDLVKRGYVVLAYDALSQGERMQFWDFVFQHRGLIDKSSEHGLLGIREMFLGQSLARDMIWDGLRGLDYLTSLPEVDATRIGVTGNSGGGTLTTYIGLLDPRVKAVSIVTFVTSIPKKIEARDIDSESDPEQDIQGLLAAGMDHAELVAMIAPRPVLIGAALRDFFPIDGTRQTYGELQKLYAKLAASERLKMVSFDHEHMYSQPLREATTEWFNRWLKREEGKIHEPAMTVEKESTLWCTPTGQLVSSFGGKRLLDIHRVEVERLAAELAKKRQQPSFRAELAGKIRQRLALPETRVNVRSRTVGDVRRGDLDIEKLLLETDPGIVVPVRVLHSQNQAARQPTIVYLRDRDASAECPGLFETLSRQGWTVVIADVRGFGETMPHRQVEDTRMYCFHPRDGKDADFAYAAFSLGKPLLGMRVWDALHVLEYAHSRPDVDVGHVVLAGRGWAGVTALFAAVLDSRVSRLAVEGVPASYAALFNQEMYAQPASLILPGALQDFDLQDIYGAMAPRPLLVLNPEDESTRKLFRSEAETALEAVRTGYEAAGAAENFGVTVAPSEPEIEMELTGWIGVAPGAR